MSNYHNQRYQDKPLLRSYWHQLLEVMAINCQSFLIDSNGDGILKSSLTDYLNRARVIDIYPAMKPDSIGSIEMITAITNDKSDYIPRCQQLERLHFEKIKAIISEI